jgi:hypothetical protein
VDLTDLVVDARVEEDPLGARSFPRIDVSHDADVAGALECDFAGHASVFGRGLYAWA